MTTGQRIQQARKALGLSQRELGEQLGVSGAMVGQYENDLRNPKRETLQRIADALDVSVDWLCTGQEARRQETIGKNEINYLLGFLNLSPKDTELVYKLFRGLMSTMDKLRAEGEAKNDPEEILRLGEDCSTLIGVISDCCQCPEGIYDFQRKYDKWKARSKDIQEFISEYEALSRKNQRKVQEYIKFITFSEQQKCPPE